MNLARKEKIFVGLALVFFLMSGLYYAATNSVTSDEKTHIITGYLNLRFNDYRFNIEHPPFIKQLAAIPLLFLKINFPTDVYQAPDIENPIVDIQNNFLFLAGNDLDKIVFLSRIPNVIISLILGLFIYIYSRKLNGIFAGFISLILFVLSPLFLTHSAFVTMDVAVSCFYCMTAYFLTKYFEIKNNKSLFLVGLSLGLSLISKYSGLILIPVVYFLVIAAACRKLSFVTEFLPKKQLRNFIILLPFLIFVMSYKRSVSIVAPAFFLYMVSFAFLNKPALYARINFVGRTLLFVLVIAFSLVVLDYTKYAWFPFHSATKEYFKGFEYFKGHASGGQDSYFLGSFAHRGWWYYFPCALLLKEPLVTLLLIGLGFFGLFKREKAWEKLILIVPAFAYMFIAMFVNKVNIGVRHILPVYPFLYIIAGFGAVLAKRYNVIKYLIIILIILLSIDVLGSYPGHLSYFNRLVGNDNGYKFLGDSNIAWGQDWKRLEKFIRTQGIKEVTIDAAFSYKPICDYYKIPCKALTQQEMIIPGEGVYVIEATAFVARQIKWLDTIKPNAKVGGSLFVYIITNEEIRRIKSRAR